MFVCYVVPVYADNHETLTVVITAAQLSEPSRLLVQIQSEITKENIPLGGEKDADLP